MGQERRVYQLKVTLRGARPPIWRRFQILSDITLKRLHEILQVVMGWTNSHLHQFRVGTTYYGIADPTLDLECEDERKVRLAQVLQRPKAKIVYEYDFGDAWEHDVILESVTSPLPKARYPLVLAGKRACPPEDVGGIWGYSNFLQVIKDPKHPDHEDMIEWCGGPFDPEAFDVQEVNLAFHGGWGLTKSGG